MLDPSGERRGIFALERPRKLASVLARVRRRPVHRIAAAHVTGTVTLCPFGCALNDQAKSNAGSAVADLCLCLAASLEPETSGGLRRRLMGGAWAEVVETALGLRLDSALAWAAEQRRLFAGIPAGLRPDRRETAPAVLERVWTEHLAKRRAMLARLEELVAALNAAGIIPLLLKGARSLWTGAPEWRSLRDLDLLVYGDAERAQAIALANGYKCSDSGEGRHPRSFYHADNLYRDDLPGWVEVHRLAGSTRSEILLGSRELVGVATPMSRGGAMALVLPRGLRPLARYDPPSRGPPGSA